MYQALYKNRILKKILFLKTSKAFSLIEILVVIVILAFVFTLTSSKFGKKGKKVKTIFEQLIRLNRRLVTVSKLHSQTYRLVIHMRADGQDQYWVEKKENQKKRQNLLDSSSVLLKESNSSKKDNFYRDDSFYKKEEVIPGFLDIIKVESAVWAEDKTEGKVYIYYYPQGLAQETAIQFFRQDNEAKWTLYLDPVTKEMTTLNQEINLAPGGGIQ